MIVRHPHSLISTCGEGNEPVPRCSLPYREGDWFAVPLRTGGYALGLAARSNRRGIVLGYFVGPRSTQLPTVEQTQGLAAGNAVYVGMFGDLGLLHGEWPVIGQGTGFSRADWPLPN